MNSWQYSGSSARRTLVTFTRPVSGLTSRESPSPNHLPTLSQWFRVLSELARRFGFNSITVAGAAPELSDHFDDQSDDQFDPDAPASRYSNLTVGNTK
jgi:hypothetical protein